MKHFALVLLDQPAMPSGQDVVRCFSTYATPGESLAVSKQDSGIVSFNLGRGVIGLMVLMPYAIPGEEAEWNAQFSAFALFSAWKPPAHNAYLMVDTREANDASAIESISEFTSFLAAVIDASHAIGVYWGDAVATHPAEYFLAQARQRDDPILSRFPLWTGVSVADEGNGSFSILSRGLGQFGVPNLLVIAPDTEDPAAVLTFFDLALYIVKRGQAIPEGDTVGSTESERFPVHYVPSPVDPKIKVCRVELR